MKNPANPGNKNRSAASNLILLIFLIIASYSNFSVPLIKIVFLLYWRYISTILVLKQYWNYYIIVFVLGRRCVGFVWRRCLTRGYKPCVKQAVFPCLQYIGDCEIQQFNVLAAFKSSNHKFLSASGRGRSPLRPSVRWGQRPLRLLLSPTSAITYIV
jgi:hypothetical protein